VLEEHSAGAHGHRWGNCLRETEGICTTMSWNIDLVLLSAVDGIFIPDYVPDLLVGHVDMIGFEEATSVMRFEPPQLCATRLDAWGVVIDVPCKLRAFPGYLRERSRARSVHIIHVGHSPMLLTHTEGHEVRALNGLDACKAYLLTQPHNCADLDDGELVAWSLAQQIVGKPIIDALWKNSFAVFSLGTA
jgi:hypothetical protein